MAGQFVTRWLLAAALFNLTVPCQANPSPLSAEVQPLTLRPRTQAPASVDLKFHSQTRTLLEGTLDIEAWADDRLLFRQEIPDMALPPGDSRQRLLLPPPSNSTPNVQDLRLRFRTRTGVHDLGRFPTAGEPSNKRQYLIGVCRPESSVTTKPLLSWSALRPEYLSTAEEKFTTPLVSAPAWFAPEDLPTALGLCVFDLVVLEGPTLAALSPKQMAELATWVEAGGSVCIIAPLALSTDHLAFLNRLTGSGDNPAPLVRNPNGTVGRAQAVTTRSKGDDNFLLGRPKLGRCVVAFAPITEEDRFTTSGWPAANGFLAHFNTKGTSEPIDPGQILGFAQSQLLENLPRSAQMIPLSVATAILGVFVLLIGPGEWYVLGWLRRRRWTWITFPVLAAGCTIFTVKTAEGYLGSDDQRAAVVITDFADGSQALRENRIEMQFVGKNQDALTEVRQAFIIPCQNRDRYSNARMGSSGYRSSGYYYSGGPNPFVPMSKSGPRSSSRSNWVLNPVPGSRARPATATEDTATAVYRGRLPGQYGLGRSLLQWTPYFQRVMTFSPANSETRLHWEKVDIHGSLLHESLPSDAIAKLIGAEGWEVHVFRSIRLNGMFPGSNSIESTLAYLLSLPTPGSPALSPSGQSDLLDLRLDRDPLDWVVVAQRRVGREIQIQRCVYHFNAQ